MSTNGEGPDVLRVDHDPSDVPARYATFTSRFRAALIDTFVVAVAIIVIALLGDAAANIPGSGRLTWLLFFGMFFLYEPLLVWRRGATIGHSRCHVTVVAEGTGRSPGLGRAIARYLLKAVFGLPSFVTMAFTRKHQAVHDWVTRTTVRVAPSGDDMADEYQLESAGGVADEYHLERPGEIDAAPPSGVRRALVALVYLVALFVLNGIAMSIIDPHQCARAHDCSAGTRMTIDVVALLWLATSLGTVVAAWEGLLLGARRRRVAAADDGVDTAVI